MLGSLRAGPAPDPRLVSCPDVMPLHTSSVSEIVQDEVSRDNTNGFSLNFSMLSLILKRFLENLQYTCT